MLARGQSKQFYQHLITLFQGLKSSLVSSRPCFLLPRTTNNAPGAGHYLAVSCALDDDLSFADEQAAVITLPSAPEPARSSEAGVPSTPPGTSRLGSYNIFGSTSSGASGGSGKPGLGMFIAGGGANGSSGATPGSHSTALVLAAGPHQVLLPPDATEGEGGRKEGCRG